MADAQLILVAGALLACGLLASLAASRLRIPGLVLFLGVGMLLGSDGLGWIDFADYGLARRVGIIALVLILFEGGLTSGVRRDPPRSWRGREPRAGGDVRHGADRRAHCGLALRLLDASRTVARIDVASTDGAAVFALLRGRRCGASLRARSRARPGSTTRSPSCSCSASSSGSSARTTALVDMLGLFAQQLGIGLAIGVAVGWLAVQAFRHVRLATAGLYPVASLAVAALAYGGAASCTARGSWPSISPL